MDKIVSFTNGELNYANTLEHLNILDADYYFKLMDSMQQQDLAGTMLLFDDINRKGFEGDMVLNGFAEFIRNLLVCKDEKVAALLEVVENFKDKYISTAKKIPAPWLISALNILNETEINYKAARNKRLHVELALIKLTYLQQALELSLGDDVTVKKKLVAQAKPVAFRKIAPVPIIDNNNSDGSNIKGKGKASAKLIINEGPAPEIIVTETNPEIYSTSPVREEVATVAASPKISMLQNIRQQFSGKQNEIAEKSIPLSEEKLTELWKNYTQRLRDKKNPAAQSFDIARLRIVDSATFELICNNNLEQKFIEQERNNLNEYFQQAFNNKTLQYSIVIDAHYKEVEPAEKPLSTKDQFLKMAEQYPLVKELKDRLRLELDY
jgi:DNA polymerase-3 subunit gamma/tau